MTQRRLFALIWRANAVLILITGILASGVLAFAGWEIYKDVTGTRHASNVLNVAAEQIDTSKVRLGQFERIEGSTTLRVPLMVEQGYGFGSGSKDTSSVQNYLFYDAEKGTSHWLLPGNKGLFLSNHQFPDRDYSDRKKPIVAFVYELVESDSSGDRKLTASDKKVIGISDAAGARFTRLFSGVEELNGTALTDTGRIVVLYTAAGVLKAAEVDAEEHKVVRDGPLRPVDQR